MALYCRQTTHLPYRCTCLLAGSHLLYLFLIIHLSSGADNISRIHSLSGDDILHSPGGKFALGFFRPGNSSNYYIGIWYSNPGRQTVVWVANRDSPISDKYSSELKVVEGNLVLLNESKHLTWSTNVSSTTPNSVVAVLLDDGNLVLKDGSNSNDPAVWQSFDFLTDTILPGSKLGYSKVRKTKQFLTSWKNANDPGTGLFYFELNPSKLQYEVRRNRSKVHWTGGPWNGKIFSGLPEMRSNYLYNSSFIVTENETYYTYTLYDTSILSRFVLGASGQIEQLTWQPDTQEWLLFWSQPRLNCEVYAACGAFSSCSQTSFPSCRCLTGFIARSEVDWNLGDYSGGCVRRTNLVCGNTKEANVDKQNFIKSSKLRFPQSSHRLPVRTAGECESICLNNCSCTAYAYSIEMCEIWNDELLNIRYSEVDSNATTVSIKLASDDLQIKRSNGKGNGKVIGIIFSAVIFVVILSCSIGYVSYKRRRVKKRQGQSGEDGNEGIDVPFFDFESILAATDDFSDANKLGKGGFGSVYKGKLPGGQEIAVKRLSSHSGQGIEEFKNEVVLIAKLQHRNLVKVLGYCTKEDEKIVLYEYMPNKSLDTFIFDLARRKFLDWPKRFDVILGIARGLVYLHQDSRLRIIHRDMKTSNILLDNEMNPKISDFGLARIIGGRETEACTKRVVGTYGYMSPEYAFHGHFSIKSDVFSFGVVMLEIITGKKNKGFIHSDQPFGLLGYAWSLWIEDKPLDLIDDSLVDSLNSDEALKCIIIALLCVQEDPCDRPPMKDVLLMLGGDTADLLYPKQPAFVPREHLPCFSSITLKTESSNGLTISVEEGR